MKTKKAIFLGVALLLMVSLMFPVGCAKEAEIPTPTPEPAIPAHFSTYTDDASLFSISYPPEWETALSTMEEAEQAAKELVTSIDSDFPVEKFAIIFIAGLPTDIGYMPNINIGVEPLPWGISTLDGVVEASVKGIKTIVDDYHEFTRLKTTVGGREATILNCEVTYPQVGSFHSMQMYMIIGKNIWVVSCTTTPEAFSEWEDDLHSVVRSLRILR